MRTLNRIQPHILKTESQTLPDECRVACRDHEPRCTCKSRGGGEREESYGRADSHASCMSHTGVIYGSKHGCGGRCYHRRQNGAFLSGGTGRRWLRQGLGFVPASKGERDERKADGGTAQRASRQQRSSLRFDIFPLSMRAYDTAASIDRAVSASDTQCHPRTRQRARPHVEDDTKPRPQNGREQPVGLSLFVTASTNSRPCIAGCAANSDWSPGVGDLKKENQSARRLIGDQ